MSKGSRQRPAQISKEELDKRWEMVFGKKKQSHTDKSKKDK
jgi:hypothetical protein